MVGVDALDVEHGQPLDVLLRSVTVRRHVGEGGTNSIPYNSQRPLYAVTLVLTAGFGVRYGENGLEPFNENSGI